MLPLDDLTVLDFCHGGPGSYSTMFLADFGSNVIRVDAPHGVLEPFREFGVDETLSPEKVAAFTILHRNKRSIMVDMKHPEGKEVIKNLSRKADVIVEGFSPGVMERLGVGYQDLTSENPGLIYCSMTGFGQDGPYARLPGHDWNYTGIGGALSLIGPRNGPPYLPASLIADVAGAGLHAVVGILVALAARQRTGKGQYIDIAYLDGVISLLAGEASGYFLTGKVPRRGETHKTGGAPWANVYKCKDGKYITLGCFEPRFWENLCRAIDREDLIPRQNPPLEELDDIKEELSGVFSTRTRDEWFEFFKDKNTCVAPIYELNETFKDPQVKHRKMIVELEDAELGKISQTGLPIKLSDTPGEIRTIGKPDGADTDAVLLDIGYTREDISRLRAVKAVQ